MQPEITLFVTEKQVYYYHQITLFVTGKQVYYYHQITISTNEIHG